MIDLDWRYKIWLRRRTLLWEDGPWSNDTVTYTYNSARRRKTMALAQWRMVTNEYRICQDDSLTFSQHLGFIDTFIHPPQAEKSWGLDFRWFVDNQPVRLQSADDRYQFGTAV